MKKRLVGQVVAQTRVECDPPYVEEQVFAESLDKGALKIELLRVGWKRRDRCCCCVSELMAARLDDSDFAPPRAGLSGSSEGVRERERNRPSPLTDRRRKSNPARWRQQIGRRVPLGKLRQENNN